MSCSREKPWSMRCWIDSNIAASLLKSKGRLYERLLRKMIRFPQLNLLNALLKITSIDILMLISGFDQLQSYNPGSGLNQQRTIITKPYEYCFCDYTSSGTLIFAESQRRVATLFFAAISRCQVAARPLFLQSGRCWGPAELQCQCL